MKQIPQKERLVKISRCFYGTGISVYGIQQVVYGDFRPAILPPSWPAWMHAYGICAYIIGVALIAAGTFILLDKKTGIISLLLGTLLLILLTGFQFPFTIFVQPNKPYHLGLWISPLEELALSGGAFVVAGLYKNDLKLLPENYFFRLAEKFIPLGRVFFCTTIVLFGICHFFYTSSVASLVPAWFPDPVFWAYFAGIALIGSGVAIILEIKTRRIALLLSLMLILWVIILHIPRAIAYPFTENGNEITSVFEALAYSGSALGISCMYQPVNKKIKIRVTETSVL